MLPIALLLQVLLFGSLVLVNAVHSDDVDPREKGETLVRVKRGNYGERYSGGLGAQSSFGNGYGGTNIAGASFSGTGQTQVLFDDIAQKAISGASNNFVNQYQATINAQASSAAGLDAAQQNGQHAAAYAGLAANQVGQWYNSIATGHVPAVYKGEYRRRRR